MIKSLRLAIGVLALLVAAGCSKPYLITRPLDQPLSTPVVIGVGAITDDLPADTPEDKKPTAEDLDKLRHYLEDEIDKRETLRLAAEADDGRNYEVDASLLKYSRGSGALRFLVGFGAGTARATLTLELVDKDTDAVVFSGNFTGVVKSWAEGGDKMFKMIAANFAKELDKQLKSLAK